MRGIGEAMTYRVTKQDDGLFTIHDVSIFVECERGGVKYDSKWLDDATSIAKAEEQFGYRPPAFIRHNDLDAKLLSKGDEEADGRLANFRRQKVRSRGELREGIVANITDVSEDTVERVTKHRLPGRSIEAILPATRRRIDGLALLGRTPPYHTLAQGSEPRDLALFQAHDGDAVSLFVELDAPETFMQPPPAPGAPMPAQQPAAPQPADPAVVAAFQALAKALGIGGAAPAQPAPAAPKPAPQPPAAHMDAKPGEVDLLREKVKLLESQLEVRDEQFKLASGSAEQAVADLAASKQEEAILAEIADLEKTGVSFSETYVRSNIAKFGLETFRSEFKPLLNRAPIVPPTGIPPNPMDRGAVAKFAAFEADEDLKKFASLPDAEKEAALASAREYDEAAKRDGSAFTDSNPRDRFIAADLTRFRAQG